MQKVYRISFFTTIAFLCFVVCTCCNSVKTVTTPTPPIEEAISPTPALTLDELVEDILADNIEVRLVSIYALENYGTEAKIAIPALIENLKVNDLDVRIAAAYILGKLGPEAIDAVPDLVFMLQKDSHHAQIAASDALSLIGDPSAVPYLVAILFEEKTREDTMYFVQISCAEAISTLSGELFIDVGKDAYTLNQEGIPLIVLEAQQWWLEEGKFQDWTK